MTAHSVKLPGLWAARVLKGWSQERLAAESGVNRDSISRLEMDRAGAYPRTVRRLAAALQVPARDLLASDGETGCT